MYQQDYQNLKELIEENLLSFLPKKEEESRKVVESMEYSLMCGGKRIRPILFLAACQFCGKDEKKALNFACAIEYIHTYSLIHDDLPAMDDDAFRRGKPSNHMVFGEAIAILAGDGLLNLAYEIMLADISSEPENEKRKEKSLAAFEIGRAAGCMGMIGGQTADLLSEDLQNPSLALLQFIHTHKTGALLKTAVRAGAIYSGADEGMLRDLGIYGEKLGLAFQIADDVLDITSSKEILGKPVGSDLEKQKLTYPSLLGLEKSKELFFSLHKQAVGAIESYGNQSRFLIELAEELKDRTY